jgi:hypothetical protein
LIEKDSDQSVAFSVTIPVDFERNMVDEPHVVATFSPEHYEWAKKSLNDLITRAYALEVQAAQHTSENPPPDEVVADVDDWFFAPYPVLHAWPDHLNRLGTPGDPLWLQSSISARRNALQGIVPALDHEATT